MTKKEKLLARFLSEPLDFHYNELVSLLRSLGFSEVRMGKTSGSRVKFSNEKGDTIILHKPHPNGIMKRYQLKQVREILKL